MGTPNLLCACSTRLGVLKGETHFLLQVLILCDNKRSTIVPSSSLGLGAVLQQVACWLLFRGGSCSPLTGEWSEWQGYSYLPRVKSVDLVLSAGRPSSRNHWSSGLCVQRFWRISSWLKNDPQVVVWTYCVTPADENVLRLHWVCACAIKINCESAEAGQFKIKYHNVNYEQRMWSKSFTSVLW